jgi:glycosyltransferase involved in cell wall biosynthesis
MKKICIVTTGHSPFDERIYWKFALSLKEHGFNISIICSTMDISKEENGVYIKGFNGENINKREKINKLKKYISDFQPEIIIACEPVAILAASEYRSKNKVKVIADITEWYPENVAFKYPSIKKYISYYPLYFFNAWAVNKADALIIGEKGKKERYDFLAPFKEKIIIGYYPVLKYFTYSPRAVEDEFVLCYAGLISFERGIKTLIKAASELAIRNPGVKVKVKLLGKFQSSYEQKEFLKFADGFNQIKIEYAGWTTYDKISDNLKDIHICFDLRIRNFIYNNSLPIKIFEYMAAGKPFVYSDIDPIKKEFNYSLCGQLVNPDDLNEITAAAEKYLKDSELLLEHARNGRKIIEEDKNWERESLKLIEFISRF